MNNELIKRLLGEKGTEFARTIKNVNKQKIIEVNKNGRSFNVLGKSRISFWESVQKSFWEPQTFKILDTFLDKKYSYIDIGSWIGPTVLYGSQLAKHCYAIEPDPIANNELTKNIHLNENLASKISIFDFCISDSVGTAELFTNSDLLYVGGTSCSSILKGSNGKSWLVKTITFEKFVQDLKITDCNFIKMDVEGAEFKILPTMKEFLRKDKPSIMIEFHPMFIKNYLEQLNKIKPILEGYDHIYNQKLEEIDSDFLLQIDTSKTFHVILSNKTI